MDWIVKDGIKMECIGGERIEFESIELERNGLKRNGLEGIDWRRIGLERILL